MKRCGYCGRENSDEATHCQGCGTTFANNPIHSDVPRPRSPATEQMIYGAVWCIGGLLVTGVSYIAAVSSPFGGHYIIAWGAVVFGAVRFIEGLAAKSGAQTVKPQPSIMSIRPDPNELLSYGTRLEAQGRVSEALIVYKRVATEYPNSDVGRDANISYEDLQARLGGVRCP